MDSFDIWLYPTLDAFAGTKCKRILFSVELFVLMQTLKLPRPFQTSTKLTNTYITTCHIKYYMMRDCILNFCQSCKPANQKFENFGELDLRKLLCIFAYKERYFDVIIVGIFVNID